jgi:hypothetical protein
LAERDGVSLNQFIVTSLAEQIGERRRQSYANINITFQGLVSSMGAAPVLLTNLESSGALTAGSLPSAPWVTKVSEPVPSIFSSTISQSR